MGFPPLILLAMMELPPDFQAKLAKLSIPVTPRVLVVSVKDQAMTLFDDGKPKSEFRISTALKGTGQKLNSNQTPLGLHRIKQKVGKDAPKGAIFEERVFKGQVWLPSARDLAAPVATTNATDRADGGAVEDNDLITSRILWLDGLEPGFNAGARADGTNVDSHQRFIYIHGTNHEGAIGKPVSHGCVRMRNDEVIALYDQVGEGDLVWIQE